MQSEYASKEAVLWDLVNAVEKLAQAKILTPEIFTYLLNDPPHSDSLARGVLVLSDAEILTPKTLGVLGENPRYADSLCNAMCVLSRKKLLHSRIEDLKKNAENCQKWASDQIDIYSD